MTKKSSPAVPAMDRNYQDEDDHRQVMRASEIFNDRKRMAGVRRHHRKEEKRLTLVKKNMLQGRR